MLIVKCFHVIVLRIVRILIAYFVIVHYTLKKIVEEIIVIPVVG